MVAAEVANAAIKCALCSTSRVEFGVTGSKSRSGSGFEGWSKLGEEHIILFYFSTLFLVGYIAWFVFCVFLCDVYVCPWPGFDGF